MGKVITTLWVFLILIGAVHAQSYKHGYIITESHDTIYGKIRIRSNDHLLLRNDNNSKKEYYKLSELFDYGYSSENGKYSLFGPTTFPFKTTRGIIVTQKQDTLSGFIHFKSDSKIDLYNRKKEKLLELDIEDINKYADLDGVTRWYKAFPHLGGLFMNKAKVLFAEEIQKGAISLYKAHLPRKTINLNNFLPPSDRVLGVFPISGGRSTPSYILIKNEKTRIIYKASLGNIMMNDKSISEKTLGKMISDIPLAYQKMVQDGYNFDRIEEIVGYYNRLLYSAINK